MNTTPTGAPAEKNSAQDRRDNYRVHAPVNLRLRSAGTTGSSSSGQAPVAAFEELTLAAARFRKELSPAGRNFVDRVVDTLDALTGAVASASSSVDLVWGDPREVEANVSAAGIGFLWDREIPVGSMVEVEFSFAGEGSAVPFTFVGEVRRSIAVDGAWNIGLAFQDLTQVSQQRLIRQVYEVQRLTLRDRTGQS